MIMKATAKMTNGGPQGHVQDALNLSSSKGLPWATQAERNLQLAIPMDNHAIWFDTPTKFCSHDHNWPLPMKLLPKQRPLMLPVASKAGRGTPFLVVQAKIRGACRRGLAVARPKFQVSHLESPRYQTTNRIRLECLQTRRDCRQKGLK
jgi:hypothetical protein